MVQVHFLLEDLLVEAPAGTPLERIAETAGADITFGCRTGSCGTCRVQIVEGLQHCSEPGSEERDFLKGLDAPADQRLACQITVHGDVAIDYIGL